MRRRLKQWVALEHAERLSVLAMMLALPLLSLGLRIFGYVRVRRWVEDRTVKETRLATPSDIAYGKEVARLAAIAGRHGPAKATCLRQSLLVYGLLRRQRLTPELKLGVRREDATFAAHAWVELDGVPLEMVPSGHAAFDTHRVR